MRFELQQADFSSFSTCFFMFVCMPHIAPRWRVLHLFPCGVVSRIRDKGRDGGRLSRPNENTPRIRSRRPWHSVVRWFRGSRRADFASLRRWLRWRKGVRRAKGLRTLVGWRRQSQGRLPRFAIPRPRCSTLLESLVLGVLPSL